MASNATFMNQAANRFALAMKPVETRWNAVDSGTRRLILIGAVLLAAGFLLAFVWLPAVRTRDALTARLPQLEAQLGIMRSQAKEVKALENRPAAPVTTRTVADVAVLQSLFGPDAQVMVAEGGFRIVMAAVPYATWWDKTGEARARHALVLRSASLTRADPTKADRSIVAVDMRLGVEGRALISTATPTTTQPGK